MKEKYRHYHLNQKIICLVVLFGILVFVSSCGIRETNPTNVSDPVKTQKQTQRFYNIEQQLRVEYEFWKGTHHKMGGMDKNGVDCSGFVKHVYEKLFGIALPRTTKIQVTIGKHVKQSELRPGDLVFFKPSFASRHVGIYLSNKEFIHASKSSGVTLSEIGPVYWSKHYWTGRRILPD